MAKPVFYPVSFLEASTIMVDGAAEGFPADALGDRDVEQLWKDSEGGARQITAQWTDADPPAVDTWILPAGHGLVGAPLTLESSGDGAAWTARDSVTPTSAATLARTLAVPVTAAWWRLTMTTAAAAYLAELYLTAAVPLPWAPSIGSLSDGLVGDVTRVVTPGGVVRKSRHWGLRWRASWTIADIDVPDWDRITAAIYPVLEGRFCYVRDHDGVLRWVELLEPQWLADAAAVSRRNLRLELQEVAPA